MAKENVKNLRLGQFRAEMSLDAAVDQTIKRYGHGHEYAREAVDLADANKRIAQYYNDLADKKPPDPKSLADVFRTMHWRERNLVRGTGRLNITRRYIERNFLPDLGAE